MDFLFWFLLACLVIMFSLIVAVTAGTIYFFRFTILRKPTATIDNNINANTDWHKHLEFIGERREWFNLQKIEEVYTKSYDGLKLHATLMKSKNPSKKTVICFHGYTSCGKNDYVAISKFYYEKDFNVLIADARAHGESQGKYIGFGVLDRYDAEKWVEYVIERFGNNSEIFLHGISMGGATVLMASGLNLPNNVKAIISDCAYTSAYDIFS